MRVGVALLAALAAFAAVSCGAKAPDVVPAAAAATNATRAPAAWIVEVDRVAFAGLDPHSPLATAGLVWRVGASGRTLLSEGLDLAGAPSVRHDAERLLFVAREAKSDAFVVHECAPDGSARRVVVRHAGDCTRADWLPDGRIVYAARAAGSEARSALFVAKGDGSAGERITWGDDDTDPTVLSDGRILFVAARATGAGAGSVLCTVHPDGSGLAPFHAGPLPLARPRQLASLDVECVETPGDGSAPRRVVLSWDAPSRRVVDAPAEPGPSAAPHAMERWTDAVPLVARSRPQGHLSSVKPALKFGTLVAVDARSGGRGAAVRFRAGDALLGPVPLERDGSFSVRIPSDRPFRTELLDATGAVVAAETGAMWVRPGETRICVGCHDDVETGPPNVRPIALTKDPVDLTGDLTGGETRR